ncbi:MAG TPA: hypothetical protein VNY29_02505 [Terriglobales bacterium]|nr:hypothetical protein [Terriglobales bacterium]
MLRILAIGLLLAFPLPTDLGRVANPDVKQQALQDESIAGITCERILQTETIPAGSIGNERTIVVTSQTCASPELHLLLMRKRNDPRYGTTDYQLTGIQRSEPDASLFKVPSEFKANNKGSSPSH